MRQVPEYAFLKCSTDPFQGADEMAEVEQNYKRTIRKVTYRGLDLDRVPRAADAAERRAAAVAADPLPPAEARLAAEIAGQGQEACAAPGEARGGDDAPARTDHPATDAGQHDGRLQPQDLQPGGNQA